MAIKWSALASIPSAIAGTDIGCIIKAGVSYQYTVADLYSGVAVANSTSIRLGLGAAGNLTAGGTGNVVIGCNAGTTLTTGDDNTLVGYASNVSVADSSRGTALGRLAKAATDCVAVGYAALSAVTGINNTAVGAGAGALIAAGAGNTVVGASSLNSLLTGDNNTAVGVSTLPVCTGSENVAIGNGAGLRVTTGTRHVLIGRSAGDSVVDANDVTAVGHHAAQLATVTCTAVGSGAGAVLTTAIKCTLVGFQAGAALTTNGHNVTCVGYQAGLLVTGGSNTYIGSNCAPLATTGTDNVGIGNGALARLTTGEENVAVGLNAGDRIQQGSNNTFIGNYAGGDGNAGGFLAANCTAVGLEAFGDCDTTSGTAVGYRALTLCSTGVRNVAVGDSAGAAIITNSDLTAVGYNALILATGSSNSAFGSSSFATVLTTGTFNTGLGAGTAVSAAGAAYQTAIGAGATCTADNQVMLGRPTTDTVAMGKVSAIFGIATAGWGVSAVYGQGRVVGTTDVRAAAAAAYTVGAADGSFEVSGNVLVTASTTHSFSLDVSYTDEGNSARTLILPMAKLAGAFITGGLITDVTGVGPYQSAVLQIRCKASTSITIRVSNGTFTSVTYNSEGVIKQVA